MVGGQADGEERGEKERKGRVDLERRERGRGEIGENGEKRDEWGKREGGEGEEGEVDSQVREIREKGEIVKWRGRGKEERQNGVRVIIWGGKIEGKRRRRGRRRS